jgi:uncharacterized protein RhaS with RHS repeats
MRARYYDPANGRFVNQDPAKDGNNWFAYCDNDGVNKFDPTGLFTLIELLDGSANEAEFQSAAAHQASVAKGWASSKIREAMANWAKTYCQDYLGAEVKSVQWINNALRIKLDLKGTAANDWHLAADFNHGAPHFNNWLNPYLWGGNHAEIATWISFW